MDRENSPHAIKREVIDEGSTPIDSENSGIFSISRNSFDKEAGLATCRVCQCAESDRRGDVVLGFLGITPPLQDAHKSSKDVKSNWKAVLNDIESDDSCNKNCGRESGFVEFLSPNGEVFICNADIEMGFSHHQDALIELGCSCKNDLALVHYACALKWFVNHGSTVCEICGCVAKNIRTADFKKVVVSLKDYEVLRERTANGEPNPALVQRNSSVDPDAVAAIRRQRLSEISLWFNPHNNNNPVTASLVVDEQRSNIVTEEVPPADNHATKWAVEGTGIVLATGLLTVTLAWLIAPRVGKVDVLFLLEAIAIVVIVFVFYLFTHAYDLRNAQLILEQNGILKTAKSGLHILLGGICALTIVVFFRFFVLTRIKYGPARYWAILFVFWFLVFGIWASRAHGAHTT